MARSALIAGASGIVGQALARRLVADGWRVLGLARRPLADLEGVTPVAADLLEPETLARALANDAPSHLFITTWLRQPTETENCRVNGALVRNILAALAPKASLEHVALVTGLKHYLGPFESYAKGGATLQTPFREEQPRLPGENFYYTQEDEVFEAAARQGFTWSVHRPHTIIGFAVGNAMNMGLTLAVYASICRETGRPFLFPGAPQQWDGLVDITDARLLARHVAWAATSPNARNEAFNVANGDVFRWRWMWAQLAGWFGLDPAPYPGRSSPLEQQMAGDAPIWAEIVRKHGLAEPDLARLVSPWHTDADLGRPIEVVTDMSKSRRAGFLDYQESRASFFDLFGELRSRRLIP